MGSPGSGATSAEKRCCCRFYPEGHSEACKSRICAGCLTKRMFEFEEYIMEEMIKQVPHIHMVFCLPKILRGGFMRNRKYLNDLSRIAWASTKQFMQATLNRSGVPGGIQQIQTHGNVLNANAHIPNRGQKYTNYYGRYSSKSRGMRGDAVVHKKDSGKVKEQNQATEEQRHYKKKWAQLIRKVFEVDPLECPACGGEMNLISIIHERDVIRKILEHLNLWEQDLSPPAEEGYIHEPYDDGYTLSLD